MDPHHPKNKNSSIINFLVMERYGVIRHIFLSLWLLSIFVNANFLNEYEDFYKWFVFGTVFLTFIIMIYFNLYVLVPIFFFRGKYILYLLSVITVVISGLYFLLHFIASTFEVYHTHKVQRTFEINEYFSSVNIIMLVILITTTIKLLQRWILDSNRMSELKTLTLNLELNELKNQITPHFLFNMLNNIKALIRNNPQKASDIIVKLSDLLRYQLYESSNDNVKLTSEIRFVTNFLSLEKIRRDNFEYLIRTNDEMLDLRNIEIPPNLFMPFVENAIKHSGEIVDHESNVNIIFFISKKELSFSCINSITVENDQTQKNYGGLGLKNITRRLQLLYHEDEYKLDISKSSDQYTVNLKIPI